MAKGGDGFVTGMIDGHDKLARIQRRSLTREERREQERRRIEARATLSPEQCRKLDTAILHLSGLSEAARRIGQVALYQELDIVIQDIRDAGGT